MTNTERLQSEANTCQRDLLGKLGDAAADAGDANLERGYRWLCEHRKWPTEFVDRKGERCACWSGHEIRGSPARFPSGALPSNIRARISRHIGCRRYSGYTPFPDVATALAVAARVIGDWLANPKAKTKVAEKRLSASAVERMMES